MLQGSDALITDRFIHQINIMGQTDGKGFAIRVFNADIPLFIRYSDAFGSKICR